LEAEDKLIKDRQMMNKKHLLLFFGLFLMFSCNTSNEGKLSTDLVSNPKSAENKSDKAAEITFEKTEHDFGKLLQGEVVSYTFKFKNTGNAPLLISEVNKSCGCTASEYSKDPIKPDEEGTLKITYDSKGHNGFQNKTLNVKTNTNPSVTHLRIKALVLTPDKF
jgi:Protein of unknown function (DUF1573).